VSIPFGYILDWLVFGKVVKGLELVGAAIICIVNVIIGILKAKNWA